MSKRVFNFILFFLFLILLSYYRFKYTYIQGDNYVLYAQSFQTGLIDIPPYEERLLPGFPILIVLISKLTGNFILGSYLSVYLSIAGSLLLLKRIISKTKFLLFLFPPIMLAMATQVSTEYSSIFLVLLTVHLVKVKKYSLASFVSGVSFWIRPIGSLTFLALLISLFMKKEKIKPGYFLIFSIPILLLCLYNYFFFGSFSPLYQIQMYLVFSPNGNQVGIVQLFLDIGRTIVKREYNILLSGLFYLFLFLFYFRKLFLLAKTKMDTLQMFMFISVILMSAYVFSYTFTPFFENLGRYLMPIYVLFWVIFGKDIKIKSITTLILTLISIAIVII